ncbi:MAG: hypothetical protein ACP5K4_08230 [Caldisericum sp.]
MDEIFKKVLNDRDIFYMKYEIFSRDEWMSLREKFINKNDDEFIAIIDKTIKELNKKLANSSNSRNKEDIEKAIKQCKNFKKAVAEMPNILRQLFEYLELFGIVKSNLPFPSALDDYGKVIERYGISTVEQFFLDKIKRENDQNRKRALTRVLEYVRELYNSNQSALEIAYFVRKLDSLTTFWEV